MKPTRFQKELDERLVALAKSALSGDMRAFDELVRRHQSKILTNCRYLTGSGGDAEDLAQEVFVKAYFALARFEGRAAFGSWVTRIKINHCLNFNRKTRGRWFLDASDPKVQGADELTIEPRAPEKLEKDDRRQRVRAILDQMADTLRIPLVMSDMDGLTYQEIADELGIGLSAVKMRIKRGRESFRQLYDAQVSEEIPSV